MSDLKEIARDLLNQAYRKVSDGDAMAALQDVVNVLKMMGGESAVLPALQRAREAFTSGERTKEQVEQLAHLFNDISLQAEKRLLSGPSSSCESPTNTVYHGSTSQCRTAVQDVQGPPPEACILEETGREEIAVCALSDGSSFVCETCGAVVSINRRTAHEEFWCEGKNEQD